MHFEILVEDQSGKKALDNIVPKIIGKSNTFIVRSYKGVGRIPKNLRSNMDAGKRILLDHLPRLLRGYSKTFFNYPVHYPAAVILVCDLDDKCLKAFRQELYAILESCSPKPRTRFCIAIEEGEAWFLGDIPAIKTAYPKTKCAILNKYVNDSICGTWELLADAVFPGGSAKLSAMGWQAIGTEKYRWAERISQCMNISNNTSPSFIHFRDKLSDLAGLQIMGTEK